MGNVLVRVIRTPSLMLSLSLALVLSWSPAYLVSAAAMAPGPETHAISESALPQPRTVSGPAVEGVQLQVVLLQDEPEAASPAWILVRVVNRSEKVLRVGVSGDYWDYRFSLVHARTGEPVQLTRFGQRLAEWHRRPVGYRHFAFEVEPGGSLDTPIAVGRIFDISLRGHYLLSVERTFPVPGPLSGELIPLRVTDIPIQVTDPKPPPLPEPQQAAGDETE